MKEKVKGTWGGKRERKNKKEPTKVVARAVSQKPRSLSNLSVSLSHLSGMREYFRNLFASVLDLRGVSSEKGRGFRSWPFYWCKSLFLSLDLQALISPFTKLVHASIRVCPRSFISTLNSIHFAHAACISDVKGFLLSSDHWQTFSSRLKKATDKWFTVLLFPIMMLSKTLTPSEAFLIAFPEVKCRDQHEGQRPRNGRFKVELTTKETSFQTSQS